MVISLIIHECVKADPLGLKVGRIDGEGRWISNIKKKLELTY